MGAEQRLVACSLLCAGWWLALACSRAEPGGARPTTLGVGSSLAVAASTQTKPIAPRAGIGSPAETVEDAAVPHARTTTTTTTPGSRAALSVEAATTSRGSQGPRDTRDLPSNADAARPACRLLAAGDSLTDRRSGGGGYLELARRSCGCEITNLGKGGDMTNQIRKRFLAHLHASDEKYTHAVIFGGVNDLYSDLTAKRNVAKISADLEAMYRASKQRGMTVIAITVTPWGGFTRYFSEHRWSNTLRLNAWIRDGVSRGLTDAVVDGEHLLACGDEARLCARFAAPYRDGLHFGPEGHRELALALVRALGPPLCPRPPDDGPG